jgi:hypothetical protein
LFEALFQRPDQASQKSAITAAEELIQPDNISMKARLIDPNSVTALEVIMFDLASDVPSPKQVLLVESLKKEGWTMDEAGRWVAGAGTDAAKAVAMAEGASDLGGRSLQVQYLKLLVKQLGLVGEEMSKLTYLTDDYQPSPSDYMFFWINVKKVNSVSWNGKGRIEFLQALIGSMFLQSEQAAAAMNKIAQG